MAKKRHKSAPAQTTSGPVTPVAEDQGCVSEPECVTGGHLAPASLPSTKSTPLLSMGEESDKQVEEKTNEDPAAEMTINKPESSPPAAVPDTEMMTDKPESMTNKPESMPNKPESMPNKPESMTNKPESSPPMAVLATRRSSRKRTSTSKDLDSYSRAAKVVVKPAKHKCSTKKSPVAKSGDTNNGTQAEVLSKSPVAKSGDTNNGTQAEVLSKSPVAKAGDTNNGTQAEVLSKSPVAKSGDTNNGTQAEVLSKSPVAKAGDTNNGTQAEAAPMPQQRKSPRKSTRIQKNTADVIMKPAQPKLEKTKAVTRTRKRKQSVNKTTNGHGPVNGTASVPPCETSSAEPCEPACETASAALPPTQKPVMVDTATSPFIKKKVIAKSAKAASAKRKLTAKPKPVRRKQGRGKRKTKPVRQPLPSFDDDDEYFEDVFKNGAEPPETGDTCEVNGVAAVGSNHCTLQANHSAEESDMADMNGTLGTSYDDVDLDSNQSSDDDLPDLLSQDSTKIHEGDIVWAKMRNFPYWPAVVKRLYKKKGKAAVFFAGELNKSNQKGKGVSLKTMKPYSCPEKEALIEAGKKHRKVDKLEFQDAVEQTEDYITKRGLGKAQGASFFTTEDYSITVGDEINSSTTSPLSIMCTPSMKAGLPHDDEPTSPLTPPCDTPYQGVMDSPSWRAGRPLSENQDQSMEAEEGNSDVDEELMEKRKSLTKLQDRLMRYITRRPPAKKHLLRIFHSKEKSMRHKLYFTPGAEAHNRLKHMRGFGPITDDDKQDELLMFLRKVYEENCLQGDQDIVITSYLTDVWFPEVIIFALQKTQRIGHKRAEQLFISEEKNALEVTGALDDIHLPMYLTAQEKEELLENVTKRAARELGFNPRELGLS